MSQTLALDTPTATFNEPLYQSYAHEIKEEFALIGLLVGLYGILIILSLLSVYALVTQCTRKTRFTIITLLLMLFILFAATTIYVIALILGAQTSFLTSLIMAGPTLWPGSNIRLSSVLMDPPRVEDYTPIQYCAGTAALTLNIAFGDAIVCWRACVVWHGNRTVKAVCAVFLLATFALGVVDTSLICNSGWTYVHEHTKTVVVMVGFLYEGFPAGIAASVASLTTNLLSTLLVGYKAWESRKRLRGYLVAGPRTAQAKKLFALLIESGTLYATLWVIVVGSQIGKYVFVQTANPNYEGGFFDIVNVIIDGSLVPLIAIYPTIIIVLVALNRSHMERGFLPYDQSPSLPTLPVSLHSISTSDHENTDGFPQRVREVLFIGGERLGCGDGPKDATSRTSEELKLEGIV